uniref:Uncharacterized protein n=1 Tax=Cacopsylla melanoneura TaxID=428564 RepID=A0A8D8WAF7_9HEMI
MIFYLGSVQAQIVHLSISISSYIKMVLNILHYYRLLKMLIESKHSLPIVYQNDGNVHLSEHDELEKNEEIYSFPDIYNNNIRTVLGMNEKPMSYLKTLTFYRRIHYTILQ